jgi:amidase
MEIACRAGGCRERSIGAAAFPKGLPLGIAFLADHARQGLLFVLAGQLERATPWGFKRPLLATTER